MPQHEEHCQHCEKFIGVRGEDIHTWMDRHTIALGINHRASRHTPEDLIDCIKLFGKKYGIETVQKIFYDHLILDGEI
jgi:hypothetical protein